MEKREPLRLEKPTRVRLFVGMVISDYYFPMTSE
jgi:hypothetical protein